MIPFFDPPEMPGWMFWPWAIIGVIVAIVSVVLGFVGAVQAKSHHTGRYTAKDGRFILFLLTLGPLMAPIWPLALVGGGLSYYGYTVWKVGRDAHLAEIIPEIEQKRQAYRNYQKLQEQNARLELELEASTKDKS